MSECWSSKWRNEGPSFPPTSGFVGGKGGTCREREGLATFEPSFIVFLWPHEHSSWHCLQPPGYKWGIPYFRAWLLPANRPCCISNPLHFLAYPTKKAPCRTTGSSLWLAGVCTVLPRPSVSRDQLCWDWNLKKDGLRSDKHPFPGSGSLPPPYLEAFVRWLAIEECWNGSQALIWIVISEAILKST